MWDFRKQWGSFIQYQNDYNLTVFFDQTLQRFNAAVSKTSPSTCPASTRSWAATTWRGPRSWAATSRPWCAPNRTPKPATHTASPPARRPAIISPWRRLAAAPRTSPTWPRASSSPRWAGAAAYPSSTSSTPATSGTWWGTAGPTYFCWARRSLACSWTLRNCWPRSICSRSTRAPIGCHRSTLAVRRSWTEWKNCGRCIWTLRSTAAWRPSRFIRPVRIEQCFAKNQNIIRKPRQKSDKNLLFYYSFLWPRNFHQNPPNNHS